MKYLAIIKAPQDALFPSSRPLLLDAQTLDTDTKKHLAIALELSAKETEATVVVVVVLITEDENRCLKLSKKS